MKKLVPKFVRKNLGIKVLFNFSILVLFLLFSVLGIAFMKFRRQTTEKIQLIIDANAREAAAIATTKFNDYIGVISFLKQSFENIDYVPEKDRRIHLTQVLKKSFSSDISIESVWAILELNAIDQLDSLYRNKPGSTILGNFNPRFYIWNNKVTLDKKVEQNPSEIFGKQIYQRVSETNIPEFSEPYFGSLSVNKDQKYLLANMAFPVFIKGGFKGVVGFDVLFNEFSNLLEKVDKYHGSFYILVSNKGVVLSHPSHKNLGKKIDDIGLPSYDQLYIKTCIEKGISFSGKSADNTTYMSLAPVKVGSMNPMSLVAVVPLEIVNKENTNIILSVTLYGLIGVLLIIFLLFVLVKRITKPLNQITDALIGLGHGNFDQNNKLTNTNEDELAEVANAVNLLIDTMVHTSKFAIEIGQGNLESEFTPLSDEDTLGKALVEMRGNIIEARKKELTQRDIDQKKQWAATGINKLGEILRLHNHNIEELSYASLKYLIDYLGAAQGAIYIKNDDNPDDIYYGLSAALAFGREKMLESKILPEEGLVGRCAEEELSIYLTEIPQDYPEIKSGLGGSTPNVILVVPMKINEEVLGVLELISFKLFAEYEIEFVEKIGQDMASTIANVRTNQKTARLLKQSQKQSEELASKEEEMRQTIEEMNATQEEAEARFQQISSLVEAVNQIAMVAEFDPRGHITEINENFLRLLGVNRQQMIGRKQGSFETEIDGVENEAMWRKLRQGQTITKIQKVDTGYKTIVLSETYVPIKDVLGNVVKVINLATDITHTL